MAADASEYSGQAARQIARSWLQKRTCSSVAHAAFISVTRSVYGAQALWGLRCLCS